MVRNCVPIATGLRRAWETAFRLPRGPEESEKPRPDCHGIGMGGLSSSCHGAGKPRGAPCKTSPRKMMRRRLGGPDAAKQPRVAAPGGRIIAVWQSIPVSCSENGPRMAIETRRGNPEGPRRRADCAPKLLHMSLSWDNAKTPHRKSLFTTVPRTPETTFECHSAFRLPRGLGESATARLDRHRGSKSVLKRALIVAGVKLRPDCHGPGPKAGAENPASKPAWAWVPPGVCGHRCCLRVPRGSVLSKRPVTLLEVPPSRTSRTA
jgi:hypothetical protein